MDKDKGIKSSELWITIAAMACPLITAYTGVPLTPAMLATGVGGAYVLCRTLLKIVKAIKEKKEKIEIIPSVFPVTSVTP